MEPGASLAMHVSTLSKLIAWPTRRNASFAASIALMRSRKVFLVLMRSSMCEGKRTPWSHTCVSASSTKCRTCRCLIRSPTPLKLNIPGLGRRLRHGRRPTTTAPSEHTNNQSSSIVWLLFWTRRRSNFIASCWSFRPKPTFPSRLSTSKAFDASSSFAMRKLQKRYLPTNFWEAQSWTSTWTRWIQVIMQRWRRWHHLVRESASTSYSTPRKISQTRTFSVSVSFCHWRASASRSTHSFVEVDMMAWPSPNILRASCYQWSPKVGMLAPSSLTTPTIMPKLDASWHCVGPRSYSCYAMHTKSICWSRTSSPPVGKLRSLMCTPLSRHWTSRLRSGCLVYTTSWRRHTGTLWLLSKWPTRNGTQFKGC